MWQKPAADWLQLMPEVENPFMGRKMSVCGGVLKTLATAQ
jgi:hypothetical protein